MCQLIVATVFLIENPLNKDEDDENQNRFFVKKNFSRFFGTKVVLAFVRNSRLCQLGLKLCKAAEL